MPHTARVKALGPVMRIVRYWSLFDGRNRRVMCELCRTAHGLELRCGADPDSPDRAVQLEHAGQALPLAEQWRLEWLLNPAYTDHSTDEKRDPEVRNTVLNQRARRKMARVRVEPRD
jgi:hypothetical protein